LEKTKQSPPRSQTLFEEASYSLKTATVMNTPEISLAPSVFIPVAIGFFGLAVGYFVWGGQALFGFPKDAPEVNRTMGLWGLLMPGFMQFITGVYLTVGLTWFGVFDKDPPLYMAAVAFTAYGISWVATAYRRYVGASSEPDAWMAIPFLLLSILGAIVSAAAGSNAVAILYIGVALVYATEIPTRFGVFRGQRLVGLIQVLTGIWLMYLTYGTVFNIALGGHWWT
jgi:hypothetical protein